MKKYSQFVCGVLVLLVSLLPALPAQASGDVLLDTISGNRFVQVVYPHYSFIPKVSGKLESIDVEFSATDPTIRPAVDFVVNLEYPYFFPIDCVSSVVPWVSGNTGFVEHGIVTTINFSGSQCDVVAGQMYGIDFGALKVFGGVWGDSNSFGGFGIYRGTAMVDPSTPSCADGIQNQDETGVDVGGVCGGNPPPPVCTENCFPNVLFLPGIKGSVLKSGGDTLWPPTFFLNDVNELAITDTGESVNDIQTSGIIDKFYFVPVYAPFSQFMDNLKSSGDINDWLPLAYDWRFMPEQILTDGIKTEDGVIDVIGQIENLASTSKNGKVTIVAHSMGGLLGKAIIQKLSDLGKDDLIDSFVMVGTPQLGTPRAVASVLHGTDEGVLDGWIVNPISSRRVSQNMPSAYNLLPSQKYFDQVPGKIVSLDLTSNLIQAWRNLWGIDIDTYSKYISFLTGGGVRTAPRDDMLNEPTVLDVDILNQAKNFHQNFDSYVFPGHIHTVQVAGWGLPTIKELSYLTRHGLIDYNVKYTMDGDQTVISPSAIASDVDETYFLNSFKYNQSVGLNIDHKDLVGSGPVNELVKSVIEGRPIIQNDFLTSAKPDISSVGEQIIVSTHSPVLLGVFDQAGNYTGVDLDQDLSAEVLTVKEEIPGSYFDYTSTSQSVFLPKAGVYDFVYKGIGTGGTTVNIESFDGANSTPIVQFTDVPTTPSTEASFSVDGNQVINTEIALDLNGTGQATVIYSDGNAPLSLPELITLLKQKINALNISKKAKQDLLQYVNNLEKKINHKKLKAIKMLNKLGKKITMKEMKGKISSADAQALQDIIKQIDAVL